MDVDNNETYFFTKMPNKKSEFEDSKVSAESKYIILQNDILQKVNRDLEARVRDLENENEEFETEIAQLEKKHEYNKNLLKNFHEMHKWEREIASLYNEISKINCDHLKNNIRNRTRDFKYIKIVYFTIVCFMLNFYSFYKTFSYIVLIASIIAYENSNILALKIPNCQEQNNKITELYAKIKETEGAQDYIHEFICNL